VDPVPDPLLLEKSGSAVNRTRYFWICSQELRPLDILCLIEHRATKTYRGVEVYFHALLIMALFGDTLPCSRRGRLIGRRKRVRIVKRSLTVTI
jgi:hypothetical protein